MVHRLRVEENQGGRSQATRGRNVNLADSTDVRLSKKLSTLLRHRATANGLYVAPDGFVGVSEILALQNYAGVTVADLRRIVASDAKKRFSFSEDETLIRANQGHTMGVVDDDALLRRLTLDDVVNYPVCVHGTYLNYVPSILQTGLRRMSRNGVHFATGLPGEDGVISGMRRSCEALVFIDLRRAVEEDIPFFVSSNDVVLSPGIFFKGNEGVVPPKYFARVVDRHSGEDLRSSGT